MLLVHEEAVEQDTTKYQNSPELQQGGLEKVVELSSNFFSRLVQSKDHEGEEKNCATRSGNADIIDCGATHNFISNRLVQKLELS